jgi:hypothetical protein
MRRPLDPRLVNTVFDANAFDRDGGPDDADVDRLLALGCAGEITLMMPWSVRPEIEHPRTPAHVRQAALPQIFSYRVELTDSERELYRRIRAILQGNATPGKHDADARHVAEAAKYGAGYFITHDHRINRTKRASLEAVLPPSLWIVTLAEFLAIHDRYAATGPAAARREPTMKERKRTG